MSDLCGTIAGMVTPKGSMSTEGERLQFPSYLTGTDMLLSAVSVLVVAQPSLEVPEGLMNYPVLKNYTHTSQNKLLLRYKGKSYKLF
jgi:hypothetical protein